METKTTYLHIVRHGEPISKDDDGNPVGSSINLLLHNNWWVTSILDPLGLSIIENIWRKVQENTPWENRLTRFGHRQAKKSGDYLASQIQNGSIDLIYSPAVRTQQTAADVVQKLEQKGIKVDYMHQSPNVQERGRGLLDPKFSKFEDLEAFYIYHVFGRGRLRVAERPLEFGDITPDTRAFVEKNIGSLSEVDLLGESKTDVVKRLDEPVQELRRLRDAQQTPTKHVVLVSHKAISEILFNKLGLQKPDSLPFGAVVTLVNHDGKNWELQSVWAPKQRPRRKHFLIYPTHRNIFTIFNKWYSERRKLTLH